MAQRTTCLSEWSVSFHSDASCGCVSETGTAFSVIARTYLIINI